MRGQVIEQETFGGGAQAGESTVTVDGAGRVWREIDALGRITEYAYDEAGRRTAQTLALGTTAEATTDYTLDVLGRVKTLTDGNGNETSFTYNGADQQTSMTDPHGETVTKTYDQRGWLKSVTDRNGRTREFLYDGAGRLIEEKWLEGATEVDTAEYSYDLMGRMLTASNGNGAYEYTFVYDALGRITQVTEPFGVELDFEYDPQGNRTLVEDSFGGSVASTYDGAQRLLSRVFTQGSQTLRVDQQYDLAGRLIGQTRYNGASQVGDSVIGHDGAGRITSLVHNDGSATPVAEYDFTYDGAGQLMSQTDHGDLREYTYDDQGQLTDDDQGNTFTYDALGNRDGYTYDATYDNQLTSDGTWLYEYDDEGNITKKVKISDGLTWVYGYNHKNQLIRAEEWEEDNLIAPRLSTAEYKYDVFGNRIEKTVDVDGDGDVDKTERYAYDGWKRTGSQAIGNENWDVLFDLDATGSLTTRYIRGDAVDEVFAHINGDGAFWLLPDHLGSIRDVANASGAVVERLGYDGFGNINSIKDGNGNLIADAEYVGRYRFTGREFDVETGLQYSRARYYDASIGRWINQDPLSFDAGDSNLYRYVNNRPTVATDPSGLAENPLITYPWAIIRGMGEGLWNVGRGAVKAGGEVVYMGSDVLRMGGSAASLVGNKVLGTGVYVPEYKSAIAKGAVEAGARGQLGNFTAGAVLDGGSLGIAPIIKAVASGDPQAAGDVAGALIVGAAGFKVSQNPHSMLRVTPKASAEAPAPSSAGMNGPNAPPSPVPLTPAEIAAAQARGPIPVAEISGGAAAAGFAALARAALQSLGLNDAQIQALAGGNSVAFDVAGVARGTIGIARLAPNGRLQAGIYTIRNVGGGLADFLTFEARAQAAARAIGASELELMGLELNNAALEAALVRGGFTPVEIPAPAELGGGTARGISRVEPVTPNK